MVGVHGPREEEGHVRRDVVVVDEHVYGRKDVYVLVGGERGREELAELHERVLTLVVQAAGELHVPLVDRGAAAAAAAATGRFGALRLVGEHDVVALLREEYAEREDEAVVGERLLESIGALLDVANGVEVAGLLAEYVAAGHRLQLQVVDLGEDLDAAHLLHDLLEYEEVVAAASLELIDHVLDHGDELDGVLFERESAKGGHTLQPRGQIGRVELHLLLVAVRDGHDDAVGEHVVAQRRHELQRVHHRQDEVVVALNLRENLFVHDNNNNNFSGIERERERENERMLLT